MVTTYPTHSPHDGGVDPTFSRALRYELAGEEGRALAASYGIATTLALAFLLAVRLAPPAIVDVMRSVAPPPDSVIVIPYFGPLPTLPPVDVRPEDGRPGAGPARGGHQTPGGAHGVQSRAADPAGAFVGSGGLSGAASSALAGVEVATARGGTPGAAGGHAIVLSTGADARGLGQASFGGDARGDVARVGGSLGGSAGVAHSAAHVAMPPSVTVPALPDAGPNAAAVGLAVRARAATLESCYVREGLSRNRDLAGAVTLALSVDAAGRVNSADISRRTWSGTGATETESCILTTARRWTFGAGGGQYSLPLSFTH